MDEAVKRIVERFELTPHPEGGYFRQIYRSATVLTHPAIPAGKPRERAAGTLIYFLLADEDFSAFHRVKWSDEIWHLYAGGPLEINVIDGTGTLDRRILTMDLAAGEPTTVVAAGNWQATRLGTGAAWSFGGCTVAPGFDFDDFEMPPAGQLIARFPDHAGLIRELTRR